jgi:hypothetical protein
MKKKLTINDYKDRFTAPVGAVRIDPKTNKPVRKKTVKKGK